MDQLHKRFTDEQIKVLFQLYCQGLLRRDTVQEILRIGKSQLFVLLKRYRQDPESFSVSYKRATPPRLSVTDEAEIERALLQEQEIVENTDCRSLATTIPPCETASRRKASTPQ